MEARANKKAEHEPELLIEQSWFEENTAGKAALTIVNVKNATVKNVTCQHNMCTGIKVVASALIIMNRLNMVNNCGINGGAISIQSEVAFLLDRVPPPQLTLKANSEVYLTNNSASFGGGVFIDRACPVKNCFVTFENNSALYLSGNVATKGGDAVYGGCLSNCTIEKTKVNITNEGNFFWDFVKSENHQSQST